MDKPLKTSIYSVGQIAPAHVGRLTGLQCSSSNCLGRPCCASHTRRVLRADSHLENCCINHFDRFGYPIDPSAAQQGLRNIRRSVAGALGLADVARGYLSSTHCQRKPWAPLWQTHFLKMPKWRETIQPFIGPNLSRDARVVGRASSRFVAA